MKYIVIELQSSDAGVANIVTQHDSLPQAYNKFYTVLAAAAISLVPKHSAVLMDDRGFEIDHKYFDRTENSEE